MKVAYLGPKGTYTYGACLKHFGKDIQLGALNSIAEVFEEVEARKFDYGVLPIENSSEGAVTHTFDCLGNSSLVICHEIEMKIEHSLVCAPGEDCAEIKWVYSHPQALAQCRQWLRKYYPQAIQLTFTSTTVAIEEMLNHRSCAAIASSHAIEHYDLKTVSQGINDRLENITRFLVLGHKITAKRTGHDKTSLMLAQENKPGSLVKILLPFAEENVNLTRIESRPDLRKIWHYVFFVEMDGHIEDENIKKVLKKLQMQKVTVKILGSYSKAAPC